MRLLIVGPGRAGGSVALAAAAAGHEIAGVVSRSGDDRFGPPLDLEASLPPADLLLVAVGDEAIAGVAASLAPRAGSVPVAAHLSGFLPTTALLRLADRGIAIGGFHPLQTLPDPESGAAALAGSYAGIGGEGLAFDTLSGFASSLGMDWFRLSDEMRPSYHAAAAAAANFVIASLSVAGDLFEQAAVDPKVAEPLVQQAVANFFEQGASALTGPIARGDTLTVRGHLEAAQEVSADVGRQFRLMAEATAIRANRSNEVAEWS
jgi:predicted short-subunit dehydrogenase-like oxidoreductase (DUF2520 family)